MASHSLEYHSHTVGGNGAQLETDERVFLDRPKSCFRWFYLELPYNNDRESDCLP